MISSQHKGTRISRRERRPASERRSSRLRRVIRLLLLALLLTVAALLSTVTGFYVSLASNMPSLEAQGEYKAAQTTKIYDGGPEPELLAELHGNEHREVVRGDRISNHMRHAVIAIEDERFYSHKGVDFVGILRALWTDIRHGSIVQGGSTITQQFVKNAYVSNNRTLDRKIKEAALAYQLEKQWSKDKILDEYLNIIYFGEGAYGVEAAAQTYFNKHARDLTPAEAALLAAIPKSPATYSPRKDKQAALARRNLILNKMYQQGYLSTAALQEALESPIALAPPRTSSNRKAPYWVDFVREQLVSRYGASTVLRGGLRVYTSLDLSRQSAAEQAVQGVLNQPGDPTGALVSIDLRTGRIVAMVGGSDYRKQQFNIAVQGHRQPGSAFKTFVLVTALKKGISPYRGFESGPITIELPGEDWNVESRDVGEVTLAEATAKSINGTFARLIMEVGTKDTVATARELGIQTKINEDPAIALGGLRTGVSPLEMAVAYGSIGTGGERLSGSVVFQSENQLYPISIVRVEDSEGNVLDENRVVRTRVLDPRVAWMTTEILKGVIEHGTGREANINRPAAGKTGTTQDYRDAWFVGYTPDMVTAVWVGYPDTQKPMTDVHGIRVTGGSFPARIWAQYMRRALADVEPRDFAKPAGTERVTVNIDPETGLLATPWCPKSVERTFLKGMEPTRYCTLHQPQEITLPDLSGMTLDEARAELSRLKFKVQVNEQEDPSVAAGVVLSQEPSAGMKLLQGSTVTLIVSAGSAKVPYLIGDDIEGAERKLTRAGYNVKVSERPADEPVGRVLDQTPAGGAPLPEGGTVTLVVSAGPSATTTSGTSPGNSGVVVPGVVGEHLAHALLVMRRAGLDGVVLSTRHPTDPGQAGRVASQSVPSGAIVPPGTVIQLVVFGPD